MSNSLTNKGEQYMLAGDVASPPTANGGLARLATALRLYDSTSVPDKDGTGFVEVANGNGYTTGGMAIDETDWTFSVVSTQGQIQLADQIWTASGGNIANVAGAYITDAAGNALAWWERTPATATPGDTITADDLIIRLS